MRPETGLLFRLVAHDKVHDGVNRVVIVARVDLQSKGAYLPSQFGSTLVSAS